MEEKDAYDHLAIHHAGFRFLFEMQLNHNLLCRYIYCLALSIRP